MRFGTKLEPSGQYHEAGVPGTLLYIEGLPPWLPDPKESPFKVEFEKQRQPGFGETIRIDVSSRVTRGSWQVAVEAASEHIIAEVVDHMTREIKGKMIEDFGLHGELERRLRLAHQTELQKLHTAITRGAITDLEGVKNWIIDDLGRIN